MPAGLPRISGLKSMLLEKKVEALSGALEMREAQLGEVLAAAQIDPATLQQVGVLAAWKGARVKHCAQKPLSAPWTRHNVYDVGLSFQTIRWRGSGDCKGC